MKIGMEPTRLKPEVHLPVEVVHLIDPLLLSNPPAHQSIWSCCLVCRLWYAVAVHKLYETPILTNWNFEHFASTVCPPIRSNVRKVGLEHYVKHLDMSTLAYESSNSQTARMLGRVSRSLEVFVAPATSFS